MIRDSDFGTNILNGPYSGTYFSKAVSRTLETGETLFSDLERYEPSNNRIQGFITSSLIDLQGEKVGALAIQIKMDRMACSKFI